MPSINIIVGPPCAGKSSFVVDNAQAGDVLVDLDKIAMALGSEVSHSSYGAVKSAALAARSAVIEIILSGVDSDAWIIDTSPRQEQINNYEAAGAIFYLLNPGLEECNKRADKDSRPDETKAAIANWYENQPNLPESTIVNNSKPFKVALARRRLELI